MAELCPDPASIIPKPVSSSVTCSGRSLRGRYPNFTDMVRNAYRYSGVINQALAGAFGSSEPEPVNNSAGDILSLHTKHLDFLMWLKENTHRPATNRRNQTLDVYSPTSRAGTVRFGTTTNTQMSPLPKAGLYELRSPEASVFLFSYMQIKEQRDEP